MTIRLNIKPEVAAELARQADRCGVDVRAYAANLLESATQLHARGSNKVHRLLAPLEKKVLTIAQQEYKNRYSGANAARSAPVHRLLRAVEFDTLFNDLRKLAPDLKVKLKTVLGKLEDLILDASDAAPFCCDERREAYIFLLSISDTTIPE